MHQTRDPSQHGTTNHAWGIRSHKTTCQVYLIDSLYMVLRPRDRERERERVRERREKRRRERTKFDMLRLFAAYLFS